MENDTCNFFYAKNTYRAAHTKDPPETDTIPRYLPTPLVLEGYRCSCREESSPSISELAYGLSQAPALIEVKFSLERNFSGWWYC